MGNHGHVKADGGYDLGMKIFEKFRLLGENRFYIYMKKILQGENLWNESCLENTSILQDALNFIAFKQVLALRRDDVDSASH